jgi:hypothetical protein
MDYNSEVNQGIKGRFVDREVIYCVSNLVYELAKKAECFPDYEDELYGAFQGEPDYEEVLEANGWEQLEDEFGAEFWRDTNDNMTWTGTAEEVCLEFGIDYDDYRPEIYEHWIVSNFLADRLEEKGELILRDFFGMTVWGRACSGQAIKLDGVISEICSDMGILEGQENDWSKQS